MSGGGGVKRGKEKRGQAYRGVSPDSTVHAHPRPHARPRLWQHPCIQICATLSLAHACNPKVPPPLVCRLAVHAPWKRGHLGTTLTRGQTSVHKATLPHSRVLMSHFHSPTCVCRLVVHTPWKRVHLPDPGPAPWQSQTTVIVAFCVVPG